MRKIIGKKNKVQYVDETTRFKMVKSHKGWLVIGASMLALAVGLNISVTTAHASQIDGQWAPRTVQEIKADFEKSNLSKSYTIQWGDTLSAISAAINVDQDRLAQINSIENKDLIFAGNTIQIDGTGTDATIIIKDKDGKADTVYNIDPSKPLVNDEKTHELTVNDSLNTGVSKSNPVNPTKPTGDTNESGNHTESGNHNDTPAATPTNKTELEKLKETLLTQNSNLSKLQSELSTAQADLDAAKSALETAEDNDASKFEAMVKAQTERLNDVQSEVTNLQVAIDSDTTELQNVKAITEATKVDITNAENNILTAQNELAAVKSKSDMTQTAYSQILSNISATYPNINAETAEGLASLKDLDPNLSASFEAAKAAKTEAQFELANAETAVSNVTNVRENLQRTLVENETKTTTLQTQIDTNNTKLKASSSQLDVEKATLDDLQQKLNDIKNRNIDELRADVKTKQSIVDAIVKEIETLKVDISKTTVAIANVELKDSRVNATRVINELQYLNTSEKSNYVKQLQETLTQGDINTIVSSAETQNQSHKQEIDLKAAKTDALNQINNMKYLDEKEVFINNVNAADSIDAVATVIANATTQNTASQLAKSKAKAIADINIISGLSDAEKTTFTSSINDATSLDMVSIVVSNAKSVAEFNSYKETAKSSIKDLVNLSEDEQASFVAAVGAATSKDDVDTVMVNAKAKDKSNLDAKQLEELRQDVTTEILNLNNLSTQQKQDYILKVNVATTKVELSDLLLDAHNKNDFEKTKEDAADKIDNLTFVSDDLKSKLKNEINDAKTTSDIQRVLDYAIQVDKDAKQLQDVQDKSISEINTLEHLTAGQKDTYISEIKASNTISEVQKILAAALTESKLPESKAVAITTIEALKNLSSAEKKSFNDRVSGAKVEGDILAIVSEAKTRDTVIASQYTAVTRIMGLEYLSDSRKSEFVLQIQNATDESSIQQILDAAASEEPAAKELYDLKDVALNTIKGYTHISDDVKIAATNDVKNASSKDEVERLISDLQHKEEQAIKDELIAAKNNANSTIKAMKFLQSDQKDKFVAQTSSAEDLAVINSIVDAATAQDKIESQKGTVTFKIVGFDDQTVAIVERRIVEGAYKVTLKDLGLNDNIVFIWGDLTGTVKAQENKIVQIDVVDTTKVQTLIIEARDVETGEIIKTVTTYSTEGAMFTPSYSQLELSTDEWRVVNDIAYDDQTAKAGVVSKYTFDVKAFNPILDKSQTIIAQQELVRLINQYRVSSGLTTLATDSKLDSASTIRAKEIEETFDHVRPNGRSFSSVLTQVGYTGYRAAGENIASFGGYGNVTGIQAADFLFNQWKNSPGHNANMLTPSYTHVSFGVYTDEESVYGATIFTQ